MPLAEKLTYRKNHNVVKTYSHWVTTPVHEEFGMLEKCLCFVDTFSSQ